MRPGTLLALLLAATPALAQQTAPVASETAFKKLRESHKTKLERHGKSPQQADDDKPPAGVEVVKYRSGDLELKAWFAKPATKDGAKVPAVCFFHGGFAFGADDWQGAKPFLDAGYALLCPTVRAENGNPGDFELFYGEIDDARAAVRWLAKQPSVDAERIFTFGHSVGGGISAMLSLHDEPRVKLTGSAGGLYPPSVFLGWQDIVPFDTADETETKLRLLAHNFDQMRVRHVAYVGLRDGALAHALPALVAKAKKVAAPLETEKVPGDHLAMLAPAVKKFIERIAKEK